MDKATAVAKARGLIDRVPVSALITIDEHGFPSARPMGTLTVDDDMVVWYACSGKSAKCEQIAANERVSGYWELAAEGMEGFGWVVLKGTAEVLQDEETLDRFWNDEWVQYFPGGRSDPTYAILKVTPCCLRMLSPGEMEEATVPIAPDCCCAGGCQE
jgi:general stress protein 26